MKRHNTTHQLAAALLVAALVLPFSSCRFGRGGAGQKQDVHFKPGFNLLSPQQDIAIGQKNAAEVERQMPLLNDAAAQEYLSALGARLVAHTPGEKFPYQFKVVNVGEINAFALPGGFMYVNRGAIEAARNEAELAGVMAHEISHVALRHGTSQLSKQLVAEKGLQIAASIIGGNGTSVVDQVLGAAGNAGVSLLFLRFSRTMEKQADLTGAEILAAAGYDPHAMPEFFKVLAAEEKRSGGSVPQLLSDHPAPGDRVQYLNELIPTLRVSPNAVTDTKEFQAVRAHLRQMTPARARQLSRSGADTDPSDNPVSRPPAPAAEQSVLRAPDDSYELSIPGNWQQVTEGSEMIFAPQGAAAKIDGALNVTHGMFVGTAELPRDVRDLQPATEAYVSAQLRGNPGMQVVDAPQTTTIGGHPAMITAVGGESPVTGREERDIICTVVLPGDRLFYLVLIAPQDEAEAYNEAFQRTVASVRFRQ
jgi:Zn-dependent protease with chaperone function